MRCSNATLTAGIYFLHYECFGHTSRVIAFGEVFKKRFPKGNLFFIQGGIEQPKARLDLCGKSYLLPGAFTDRRNFKGLTRGGGNHTDMRRKIFWDIIVRENPDLFVTEFFPLGRDECRHELIPALIKATAQGSILLGVAGYPVVTGNDNGWREKILKLYKRIVILAPSSEKEFMGASFRETRDRQRYFDFFKRNSEKIQFAGYLLPRQAVVRDDEDVDLSKPSIPEGVCRVSVVRGGGAYYPKVIAEAIRASDLLGKEYYFTVVAGPATTPREWYLFAMMTSKKKINNLILCRSVSDYEGLIRNSDVCVSVASYHSSVMLLKHRKRAVLIPFEGYGGAMSFYEQPARAAMLSEMIGARVLSIKNLTAKTLIRAVGDARRSHNIASRIPNEWFGGADVLDGTLRGLLSR